jgi:hypothetical protein
MPSGAIQQQAALITKVLFLAKLDEPKKYILGSSDQ